jgi:hypothetical protein
LVVHPPPFTGRRTLQNVVRRPHPFFWAALAPVAPATFAGITTEGRAPDVAMQSDLLYRTEVALGIFIAGYLVVALLWLAYHGQLARLTLPGGAGVDLRRFSTKADDPPASARSGKRPPQSARR